MRHKTTVIAEPGSTHMGNFDNMTHLIQIAKDADCDVVKFQWISNAEKLSKKRRAPEYLDAYRLIQFPRDWHEKLKSECDKLEIKYACTVYLSEDVEAVAPFVKFFKVSSFEAADTDFINVICSHRKEVIVSFGMNTPLFIGLNMHTEVPMTIPGIYSLHCVSGYPTPQEELNLSCIRQGFDGLSDHTLSTRTGALAVAAGAKIIEKHFRLIETPETCPDYEVSLTPEDLYWYVRNIRAAEEIMGDGIRRMMPCEEKNARYKTKT